MGFLHSGGAQRDCDKMRTTLFRHEYERRSARACRVLSPTCHVTKTDKSWRKKCRLHKNDAIALITIDVSRCCIWFLRLDTVRSPRAKGSMRAVKNGIGDSPRASSLHASRLRLCSRDDILLAANDLATDQHGF